MPADRYVAAQAPLTGPRLDAFITAHQGPLAELDYENICCQVQCSLGAMIAFLLRSISRMHVSLYQVYCNKNAVFGPQLCCFHCMNVLVRSVLTSKDCVCLYGHLYIVQAEADCNIELGNTALGSAAFVTCAASLTEGGQSTPTNQSY